MSRSTDPSAGGGARSLDPRKTSSRMSSPDRRRPATRGGRPGAAPLPLLLLLAAAAAACCAPRAAARQLASAASAPAPQQLHIVHVNGAPQRRAFRWRAAVGARPAPLGARARVVGLPGASCGDRRGRRGGGPINNLHSPARAPRLLRAAAGARECSYCMRACSFAAGRLGLPARRVECTRARAARRTRSNSERARARLSFKNPRRRAQPDRADQHIKHRLHARQRGRRRVPRRLGADQLLCKGGAESCGSAEGRVPLPGEKD